MRLILLLLCVSAIAADKPTLFRDPTLNQTHIVFSAAGDLWSVPRVGGAAVRLTSASGQEGLPRFSPDGQTIAFSGEYDGNVDVFTVPARGGVPKRQTWHPANDLLAGWTRDGKSVLFRSNRLNATRGNRLFTLALDSVVPEPLPLPMAEEGSFSPDGKQIAYMPLARPFRTWKRYRGGQATPIWLANLADSSVKPVPRTNSNDFEPMWVDDRIYFLSDRNGPSTLFSYDAKSGKVAQLLAPETFEIKSASAGPDAIVFERFGEIWLYDLKSGKTKRVPITIEADLPELRPRLETVSSRIQNAGISPAGARAAFEARGEIFTVPAEKGDVRNLTGTPGVAERDPSWSPDGKWVAYFSDESGEYQLHLRDPLAKNPPRKFKLSDPSRYFYTPVWSPDSKKIAFIDKSLRAGILDVESGNVTVVDTDRYDGPRRIRRISWSPDSQWLAYTKQMRSTLRAVFLFSLETGKCAQVTDGMSDAMEPVFDRDGKYLYFLASTNVGLNVGWRDMSAFDRPVIYSVYLAVLRKDLPSPLLPESDEEKPAGEKQADPAQPAGEAKPADAPKPAQPAKPNAPPAQVRIDLNAFEQRILPLPLPPREYVFLDAGKAGIVFALERAQPGGLTLQKFDMKTRKTEKIADGLNALEISNNGEKMLARQGTRWFITSVTAPIKPNEGTLRLEGMQARVEPRAEWKQMFHEAWRIQRDFFYDPNLHGLNLRQMIARYEPYLEAVSSRGDLNYLMADMMGEFTASHLNVAGGYAPEVKRVPVGLLGADYSIDSGRWRFARVFSGESWNPELRAPLTQPGVNVVAGEYLLAVNGRDLKSDTSVYSFFEAAAGKQTALKVGPNADGSNSREVVVVPLATEQRLRYLAWIEDNRRKVDKLSGGRLAYVHLPDTSQGGYTNFNRYYFAQAGREGAVVDERFNAGGAQPDYIIDYLKRPLLHYRNMREGEDVTGPLAGIFGPKVMLINEYAGSGGDTQPWYFRKAGVGPLVGKRTWGGLVGGLGGYPQLMDGGVVSVPAVGFWDPDKGQWVAENVGIAPDVEVEFDPKLWREGRDPQLEKAVEMLMAELHKKPPVKHTRPAFPVYHKK